LKPFSIVKRFQTSKNTLLVTWGVAPYPIRFLKKAEQKLLCAAIAAGEIGEMSPPKSVSFLEMKV
jgi:hypothetical protein